VLNYGRGYYETSQELILLIDLLKSGLKVDLVIFMDGVNWDREKDIPGFISRFHHKFHNMQFAFDKPLEEKLKWILVIKLSQSIRNIIFKKDHRAEQAPKETKKMFDNEQYIQHLINRFTINKKISTTIGQLFSIKMLFFLQPDAFYNYPIELYREDIVFSDTYLNNRTLRPEFYKRMKRRKGYIDLTNLFKKYGVNRKAIIDDLHYSPGFNRFLAENVSQYIDIHSFSTRSSSLYDSVATGFPRDHVLP
jgi:hypothetical protein